MLLEIIGKVSDIIIENEEYLTELDGKIGDGDHGVNISRGFVEVKAQLSSFDGKTPSEIFQKIGMTLVTKVGGASGALYGTAFMSAGAYLKGKTEFNDKVVVETLNEMISGVQKRGKAVLGEKTMLDTVIPVYEFLEKSVNDGKSLVEVKEEVIEVAKKGMESTKDIIATKGRAAYVGERSVGHLDPGAVSSYLMIKTVFENI